MRADDAQPVPTELLGPERADEEGHIAASLGEALSTVLREL